MSVAYDTLGYAKRLADAGIPREHAEAHAEAARDFIMSELVTKSDLAASVAAIDAKIDAQTLRLTVRLGSIMVIGIGALGGMLGLLRFLG